MDFDNVLKDVGSFGLYQKLIVGILMPAVLPCAFHAYSQLFIASTPDHWCRINDFNQFYPHVPNLIKNLTIPLEYRNGELQFSKCKMYKRGYENIVLALNETELANLKNNEVYYSNYLQSMVSSDFDIVDCKQGWIYDRTMFPNTVVMEWDLVCDRDAYTTIALVIFGIGGLIGNYIFGFLQDYWGRRPSFFVYLILEVVACALSSLAWNYHSWLVFRFVVGLTIPAILASPYVLAIELVGPQHRVLCTIMLNIAYSIGLVLLAVLVYFVREWRYLSLAVSLPLLMLFSCFFIIPESPRWLVATGNYRRAAKVMKTIAHLNRMKIPKNYEDVLRHNFAPEISKSTERQGTQVTRSYGIIDLFRTPNMRAKTIIITFVWFSNTCVYVGLSYYAPVLSGDEIWNFFLAGFVELPTYILLWPGLIFMGRRWILCISMLLGGIACLLTFWVQQNPNIMLALYCIGKMGISSAFVVLPLAASEIYPTVVRGLGMSVSSVIGMIGPIVIPIVNYLGSNMLVLPIMIMGFLLTAGGLASLLLPETMGQPLPQTIIDGENVPIRNPFVFRQPNRVLAELSTVKEETEIEI